MNPLLTLDSAFGAIAPDAVRVVVWGALSGIASMLLYARTSPQERLRGLREQTAALQKQLATYDGDFSGAMALSRQNLALSFQRFGWALGPSLLAGAPVILMLVGLHGAFAQQTVIPWGPAWVGSWITTFLVATTVAALATKSTCKID